jgi:3-ketosteroid 9alpha-monooxygenase subunit A
MQAWPGDHGELAIEGEFLMLTSPWQDERIREEVRWNTVRTGVVRWDYRARFFARAFSPGLVVTEFGPPQERHVITTAAVPTGTSGTAGSGCVARVAVGVQAGQEADLAMLVAGSHKALAEDRVLWENLDLSIAPRYDARDEPVIAFREFCAGFGRLS